MRLAMPCRDRTTEHHCSLECDGPDCPVPNVAVVAAARKLAWISWRMQMHVVPRVNRAVTRFSSLLPSNGRGKH